MRLRRLMKTVLGSTFTKKIPRKIYMKFHWNTRLPKKNNFCMLKYAHKIMVDNCEQKQGSVGE